ncbi:ubiquitin C-terminal hydrolase 12-like isoform X2 [Lycium barbarum]|uniref:ubiquitin C-terminal hydrolase 12-like isoform X2 n=1 Tax=Lycium barbarum TaxID=112863 RepID=UPI00293EB8EB|nr:ubiquitin C-terminal hydrolase 12-like isoform X2 [Lycium barbarum]
MSLITPPPIDPFISPKKEEKKQKGKEKQEACLCTMIKVARDEDLGEQIGKEIYFDLVDHDKVRTFCIQKQMPFTQFKEEVAKAFGIPVQFQRYWLWAKRQNHTYRPDRALTAQEEIQAVGELREVSNKWNNDELNLFLEVDLCLDLRPLSPPGKMIKEEILLFFKLYDPLKEKIRYVGRLFVKGSGKPLEILTKLNELAGFSPDEEIELFEEIKFEPNVMCEQIDSMLSFRDCQLEDGDIICFQKSLRNQCGEQYRFPVVPSFLKYVHNRQPEEHKIIVPTSDFPTKEPQTIEVAPVDTARTVDDPVSLCFTWTINNFSMLKVKKLYSDVFYVGGYKWRILLFPKGNNTDHLSVYLGVADAAKLPDGWSVYVQFSLVVLNQIRNKLPEKKDTKHQFNASEADWGYTSFMPLTELNDPGRGYLVDDKVTVEAYIVMPKVIDC